MLEKTHDTCLGIIKIQSLKKGSKIRWASHVCRLFTNTLVTSITEKCNFVADIQVHHSQEIQQGSK